MKKKFYFGAVLSLITALGMPMLAMAAPQTSVVTPATLQGWQEYPDTGQLSFVKDNNSPLPKGALQFDTPQNADEVQIYRDVPATAIKKINKMSYSAKRLAGPTHASPGYILGVDTNNDNKDDLYAWYEPAYNKPANFNYNKWQTFTLDATTTKFWSFDTIDATKNQGGANGANFFTLNDVANKFSKAKVIDLTLNIGSGTPGWSVRADNVTFDTTTWDFELTNVPTNKNDCKNNGYTNYTDKDGKAFATQADCVNFFNKNGNGNGGTTTTTTNTSTNVTTTNNNNVTITSNNAQNTTTGNASSSNNTSGGNTRSGESSNSNTSNVIFNLTNNPTATP